MGRLSERLSRRQHPLQQSAREFARRVAQAHAGDFEEEDLLREYVCECLTQFSAEQFDQLMELVHDQLEMVDDGEALQELLEEAVAHWSTSVEADEVGEEGLAHTWLFALPVSALHTQSLSTLRLGAKKLRAHLCKALERNDAIEQRSEVHLLPRLLTSGETDALRTGDLYRMLQSLSAGDDATALAVVADAVKAKFAAGVDEGQVTLPVEEGSTLETQECVPRTGMPEHVSFGVLVGVLRTVEEVPFVMAKALDVEHERLSEDAQGDRAAFERGHVGLMSDLRAELDALGSDLAEVLKVRRLRPLAPLDRWHDAAFKAMLHQRSSATAHHLRKLAREGGAEVSELVVGSPDLVPEALRFPVAKRDGQSLGTLEWRALQHEDWKQSSMQFFSLMRQLGVEPCFSDAAAHQLGQRPDDASLH